MTSTRLVNVCAGNLADCWSLLGSDQLCGTIKSQNFKPPEGNQTGTLGFLNKKNGSVVVSIYIYIRSRKYWCRISHLTLKLKTLQASSLKKKNKSSNKKQPKTKPKNPKCELLSLFYNHKSTQVSYFRMFRVTETKSSLIMVSWCSRILITVMKYRYIDQKIITQAQGKLFFLQWFAIVRLCLFWPAQTACSFLLRSQEKFLHKKGCQVLEQSAQGSGWVNIPRGI